uniref:Uncharacterized protein n=1 Tax=Romanomermis culicivorax TaxID=13658 RepID=A0A915IM28_ROMCU
MYKISDFKDVTSVYSLLLYYFFCNITMCKVILATLTVILIVSCYAQAYKLNAEEETADLSHNLVKRDWNGQYNNNYDEQRRREEEERRRREEEERRRREEEERRHREEEQRQRQGNWRPFP